MGNMEAKETGSDQVSRAITKEALQKSFKRIFNPLVSKSGLKMRQVFQPIIP
jgi:hypothetical protein